MPIGNAGQLDEALSSGDPRQLNEAWIFLDHIEKKRSGEGREFWKKLLGKKLKIFRAALKICPPGGKISTFGDQENINGLIAACEDQLAGLERQEVAQK